ncbi:hypothetical protein [Actinoallomurus sp. CA-142502]|uniref:hypothetical protein n=1 Tax=Actinoallomurus sp. CA-142502 TaxID=3239885 RepID=UPI003D923E18
MSRPAAPPRPEVEPEAAPKPPEQLPHAAVSPAPADGPRPGKLAALTPVLGRRKAGQALWAAHLLTEDERRQAEEILRRFR